MWAVLGDIEFELRNQPSRQDDRITADYAQHALIQGKPRSEWVGDGLDELTLELTLHALLGDPEAQIRRLKTALRAHEPLPYVLGSGDYRGVYLLTEVGTTTRRTDAQGRLISATVSVSLMEYSGRYKKPLPVPRGLSNSLLANPGARIGSAAQVIVTPTQQALGMARSAGNLLRTGVEAYSLAKALGNNPSLLMGQASQLLSLTGQALTPLLGLQDAAGLLSDGADLVQVAARAASEVQYAQSAMSPPSLESIVSQVEYAAGHMEEAQSTLAGASTRLAKLAAAVITRRA
ncbi:phage tail protein [Ectopseudomonas oleovorans]|uniref:Phage tail protein n=1 Tax=Ectopseudomonas oleovorans TaxID=301 RepID=A0A3R8WAW4_ECTOL|nr:phage tail protein [Pseudomonas oleovorans]RRW38523.1 phage tail protein [Pseudomonas oleovorans]